MNLFSRPFVCCVCRVSRPQSSLQPSWRPCRTMASLQKRKPSRMVLSERTARPPSTLTGKKPSQKRSSDAFGGLNRTDIDVSDLRRRTSPKGSFKGSKDGTSKGKAKRGSGTFKALKMQRALSPISYNKRSEIKQSIAEKDSFASFPLLPVIRDSIGAQALRGREDAVPSPIQRLAIPALLGAIKEYRRKPGSDSMQQFLLAAETGSGKTLAYLLPVIDAFKRAEMTEKEAQAMTKASEPQMPERDALFELSPPEQKQPDPSTGRPKAIVLVPTAELVDQVGSLAKSLSHTVKFRAAVLSANYSGQVIRNRLFSPGGVDLVVSTPHLLASIVEADPNIVARVTHLVIDEADSLLDRSFSPTTRAILDRATPSLKQLILCSATIPRKLDSFIEKHYPETIRLTTPNLHAIPRRVQLSVVDIEGDPYRGNRNLACADTIWNTGKEAVSEIDGPSDRVLKLIVFVNERETTEDVTAFLRSKGIDAFALNRDASERQTSDTLSDFTGHPAMTRNRASDLDASAIDSLSNRDVATGRTRQLSNVKVLVMTDIGSRGIDTLEARNVILYDVPHTSIDFIHRLGRVGRMGRRGRGFVLVGKGDRKDIVKEVRTGMFMGKALI